MRLIDMTHEISLPESNPPRDPAVTEALIQELVATNHQLQTRIDQLRHRIDMLLKQMYGPRADRLNPDQMQLFADLILEPPVPPTPLPESPPTIPPEPTPVRPAKKGHGRRTLPDHLPRETTIIDISELEKQAFGGIWTRIGEERSERLDYTPANLYVRVIIRPKYVICFENKDTQFRVAELPAEALPKVIAAPGLLADVIVSKCVDHLPLYRQEQRYARQGYPIARSTLCNWLGQAADVLTPLYELLKLQVLSANLVHTDDTPILQLDPLQDHCRQARIWTYVSTQGIVYESTDNRCQDAPVAFLSGFTGYLQCDAYAGYNSLFKRTVNPVIEVACWAHARRKFVEAESSSVRQAHEAVAHIQCLYTIEKNAKSLDAPARAAYRLARSKPLLDEFHRWLEAEQKRMLPKSPLATAIGYALNQWSALNAYVTNGNLSIDNNIAERAIKPFAIGRKNWLFFGSANGGRTLAKLCSFTATCGMLQVNPWIWLRDTLTKLPTTPADQLASLLPRKAATKTPG